jgi:hypothetical protein
MTGNTEPSWVAEQRSYKASKLAASLRNGGISTETAARYGPAGRRAAERIAGINKASDATWRQALDMLVGSAGPDALCPFCWHGDPLGTPGPKKPYGHKDPCASDPPPRR